MSICAAFGRHGGIIMLGKLIKYEFRCCARIFAILLPVFILYTAIYRGVMEFTISGTGGQTGSAISAMLFVGMTMIFILLVMGLAVFCFIYTVYRFYKNMVTDEGYLMHTLPVAPWELVTSKLIVAALEYIATILTIVLSVFIISVGMISESDIETIKQFIDMIVGSVYGNASQALGMILSVVSFAVSIISGILIPYVSIAIGQLKNNNRALWSIGVYLLINISLSMIGSIISVVLTSVMSETADAALIMNLSTGISALINVAVAVAAFVCTCKIFRENLNLR